MLDTVFWLCLALIFHVYVGYFLILKFLSWFIPSPETTPSFPGNEVPVTVLIAAYNEEKVIRRRLQNLLESEYPEDKLFILVASDGSDDRTVALAEEFQSPRIRVLDFKERRGKALTHNAAMRFVETDFVIFSDAESSFAPDYISRTLAAFQADPRVGCVVGNLVFHATDSITGSSARSFWDYEKTLRHLESRLRIFATGTGSCMAIRTALWRDLEPTDDSDFITALDVIVQGYYVLFLPEAVAYDELPANSPRREFQIRVRMTSKNLVGTLRRWGLKNWFRHPFVSFGLLSHKILRWLCPFFFAGVLISSVLLLWRGEKQYEGFVILETVLLCLAALGGIAARARTRIPLASHLFSFAVANAGMALGVIRGLTGQAPVAYRQK